jgi:hypothetical protein
MLNEYNVDTTEKILEKGKESGKSLITEFARKGKVMYAA